MIASEKQATKPKRPRITPTPIAIAPASESRPADNLRQVGTRCSLENFFASEPQAKNLKRRIAPIPIAIAPAVVPLETLDRSIQVSMKSVRDDVDGMLASQLYGRSSQSKTVNSQFIVNEEQLVALEEGVRRIRQGVKRYNDAAEIVEREAANERKRLADNLKPIMIERNEGTAAIYRDRKSALGGDVRYLYRCPLADPRTGVCVAGSSKRPFHPAMSKNVCQHIKSIHLTAKSCPLRGYRAESVPSDTFS